MPKKLYEPVKRKGRELLWADWSGSENRSFCRSELKGRGIRPVDRVGRPFERPMAGLSKTVRGSAMKVGAKAMKKKAR